MQAPQTSGPVHLMMNTSSLDCEQTSSKNGNSSEDRWRNRKPRDLGVRRLGKGSHGEKKNCCSARDASRRGERSGSMAFLVLVVGDATCMRYAAIQTSPYCICRLRICELSHEYVTTHPTPHLTNPTCPPSCTATSQCRISRPFSPPIRSPHVLLNLELL